jgi:hypothetical protein
MQLSLFSFYSRKPVTIFFPAAVFFAETCREYVLFLKTALPSFSFPGKNNGGMNFIFIILNANFIIQVWSIFLGYPYGFCARNFLVFDSTQLQCNDFSKISKFFSYRKLGVQMPDTHPVLAADSSDHPIRIYHPEKEAWPYLNIQTKVLLVSFIYSIRYCPIHQRMNANGDRYQMIYFPETK